MTHCIVEPDDVSGCHVHLSRITMHKAHPRFRARNLVSGRTNKQTHGLNGCLLFAFCGSAETVICPAVSLPLNAFCLLHIRHEQLVTNRRCTLPRFTCMTQNFEPHYAPFAASVACVHTHELQICQHRKPSNRRPEHHKPAWRLRLAQVHSRRRRRWSWRLRRAQQRRL